jgi:diguanylate cyclase
MAVVAGAGVMRFCVMWSRIAAGLLALAWCCLPAWALAQSRALQLSDATASQALWPHASVWVDASRAASIDTMLSQPPAFEPTKAPEGTLGVVKGVAWFRVEVSVAPGSAAGWVFDWGYPSMDRIDLFVVREGRVLQRATLGHDVPVQSRPLPSRTHSLPLRLEPGVRYELYLRGEPRGSVIAPMSLSKPGAYYRQASWTQSLQGLYFGFTFALLLYTLIQLASQRKLQYLGYALVVAGCGLFFAVFHGLGPEFVLPDNRWFWRHAGGISAFIAIIGSSLFFERMLSDGAGLWFARLLRGCMAASALFLLLYCTGVLSTETIVPLVSVFGLAPVAIAAPRLFARLKRADSISIAIVLGWTVLAVGNFITTGVLRGMNAASVWNLHAFQLTSVFEMLAFLYALSEQARHTRDAAERARAERDYLQTLAYTDALTGLHNRRGLAEALDRGLARASAAEPMAVFVLDLDGFKPVNDRHGHSGGDELLAVVAQRLRSSVRAQDAVARTGGDEFVIVAHGLTPEVAAELAQALLRRFDEPIVLSMGVEQVRLTIGYALGPLDDASSQGLLRIADQAMYEGKRRGKHCAVRGSLNQSSELTLAMQP